MKSYVEIDRVSLTYGAGSNEGTLAVKDTSLTIDRGDFVAVVGPSGCGKSTILKMVSGLHLATAGRVAVAGEEVKRPLKIVGMAFQNPTMLPWRNTIQNVLLPLEVADGLRDAYRRDPAPYVEQAKKLLATVGLAGFEEKFPWQLSGGIQQRASLCRALIHKPDLLLLDEPFAALDAFTREELWAVLQDLWMRERFTVILVTHDLREATYLADKVFVMSARPGRIIFERGIGLARPRTLEGCYAPEFVDHVHVLRDHISFARSGAAA